MNDINFSISIDEEGLLPGTLESTQTIGYLQLPFQITNSTQIKFDSITEQHILHELSLKSAGNDLSYSLSQNDQLLTATAGAHGPIVFSMQLNDHGAYIFTLHSHIDRPAPSNLVSDSNLSQPLDTSGWHKHSLDENLVSTPMIALSQDIATKPNEAYQLTIHHLPQHMENTTPSEIKVFWGDQQLCSLPGNSLESKGYTFSVEGDPGHENTTLQFVGIGNESFVKNYLDNVSVISAGQNKIPIDFGFSVTQSDNDVTHHHLIVNVTTTPPIELNNQEPFDIFYEQSVYQTIIINDDSPNHNPMTRINLDTLFKNLAIPAENRLVEVVQLQENGLATNVYEVKISDKSHTYQPITVADVQLSFPGGDGGLSVFQRNILIDEGGTPPLPHVEHII